MSLRVWLPLTKDLRNQGLDNVTVTNNGATFNSAGKLGGCYSFDGTDDFINLGNISSYFVGNTQPFSICFWIYSSESGTRGVIFSSYGLTSTNNFFSLEINSGSVTNNSLRFDWKASPDWARDWASDIILTPNTWIHVGITYDSTLVKFYKNGELIQTKNQVLSSLLIDSNWYLGRDSRTGTTAFSGKLNDFRIYDHCLSEMEVKQLSQGLMLHYPLNRQGFGQENLLKDSHVSVNTSSYAMHDYYFVIGEEPIEGETYTIQIKGQLGAGKVYFGPYNSGGSVSEITLYASSQKNGIYTGTFSWRKGAAANTFLRIYHMNSSTVVASTIEWVKLEKGEIATPWCPNHTDELYTIMGLNGTIEYDTSGYCNNGTRTGTFTWTSDTPKYSVSSVHTGSNYIYLDSPPTETQTIAVWAKWNTIPSGQSVILVDNGSGIGLGLMSTGILCSTSKAGNSYTFSKANLVANTWYHFVIVKTGTTTRKLYINGVEQTTTSHTSNWTYSVDQLQLGKRSTTSDGFVGKLCDFRAYATALSASDVLSLYQNCATIDPDGTIRGQIRS